MQDNNHMSFARIHGISSNMNAAIADRINNAVAAIDNVTWEEVTTVDSNTDVLYRMANYVGNYCGRTWHNTPATDDIIAYASCASTSGANGDRCQQWNVYFDQSWDVAGGTTQFLRERLACHETGHTLGLLHPNGEDDRTCMESQSYNVYSVHERKSHLDPAY